MSIEVSVVRVFTDSTGRHGNPLGIVDATTVAEPERQALATHLNFSETVFFTSDGERAEATIHTPAAELPFAGHPTVGLAWWLHEHGTPVQTLTVPAGAVRVRRSGDVTWVRARASWAPHFEFHPVASAQDVDAVDPSSFTGGNHYVWAWTDEAGGAIRSRMFAPDMGITEDEATGAAAVRITELLGRGLTVRQGRGSVLVTTLDGDWIEIGGRTVREPTITV